MNTITKTEITSTFIRMTLSDGAVVDIAVNNGYLHLSFSGIDNDAPGIIASAFHSSPFDLPRLQLANYVDITYPQRKRDY